MRPQPLLSVGIATWNRSAELPNAVWSVCRQAEKYGLTELVEIIVCDNASTDDTARVVREIQSRTPVVVRYHRNPENIGAIRNVMLTLELSRGRYWMFYGDDDMMVVDALPRIIELMRRHGEKPVIMFQMIERQATPDVCQDVDRVEELTVVESARRYFYDIGNAGVYAVHVDPARRHLARLCDSLATCWPQTEIIFSTMVESRVACPLLVTQLSTITSPNHIHNTVYTSFYMCESAVFALYRTALALRSFVGEEVFAAACTHIFRYQRLGPYARALFFFTTVNDLPEDTVETRRSLLRARRLANRWSRLPIFLLYLIAALPREFKWWLITVGVCLRFPSQAGQKLERFRREREIHHARRLEAKSGRTGARVYTAAELASW